MTRGIAVRETNFAGNLITASGAALIGYDYLLTVGRESRFFWKRKMTAASILFFVNRYLALFYYVGLGLGYFRCQSFPLSLECRTQYYIDIATRYLQYLPWAVFSTLRVYALSLKSWFWSAFTFLWSILPIPLDYYADFHNVSFNDKLVFGCRSWVLTSSLGFVDTALIRGGQIIADAVVIGVTWKAIYHTHCEKSTSFLARVMFRNGTQYFIVLVTMNILHIIFTFLPISFLHSSLLGASYVTKLSEPITTVLISRFMLDLHESNLEMARQGEMSGIQIMGSQLAGSPESYGRAAEGVAAEEWSVSSISGSDTE